MKHINLLKYRVCVGLDPHLVRGPAIIFFPLCREILCCGLAGILTVKGAPADPDIDCLERIVFHFKRIMARNLSVIITDSLQITDYLDGDSCLEEMEKCISSLKTDKSFQCLFFDAEMIARLSEIIREMKEFLSHEEIVVEDKAGLFPTAKMEIINRRLIILRDIIWTAERDILENVVKIMSISGCASREEITVPALLKYKKINYLLNCLDRLEVRGRDSAGIQLAWTIGPEVSGQLQPILAERDLREEFLRRGKSGDLVNGSLFFAPQPGKTQGTDVEGGGAGGSYLSFTYKTASIVGELGLNSRNLRKSIREDRIFHAFTKLDEVFDTAFIHTRWASVGAITQENCHPVNNFTDEIFPADDKAGHEDNFPRYGKGAWTISVVLNGDIDNYQRLRNDLEKEGISIAPAVTTDTKIIPLVIQKYLRDGDDLATAFRRTVNDFEGSHAIAMVSNVEPGRVFLALRGSGQSIYVGIAPDQYIFSSELYGLIEITPYFLKMDGEKNHLPDVSGTAGQIFILDQDSPGGLEGISACYYDGTSLTISEDQIKRAEITTRDIDRGAYDHYFLKEITESAISVKKTLRGKYHITANENGRTVTFNLGEDIITTELREALTKGRIECLIIVGHGTAAVAGEAIADAMGIYLAGSSIKCEAKIASELSGFYLTDDLRNTLVIAISQSGTTTDTNRAVAMAVERGAMALAIVNRRQSDITTKTQGVFYTSDGRDIEMSVASTKAFYSQIVAGNILALYLAQLLKTRSDDFIANELENLALAPSLMNQVLEKKQEILQAVEKTASKKKYWAIVGSGPNKVAADEIRIKLSELCYRTISSDVIENKKHIDLSSEPLIIVCAAGSPEAVLGDIIKDVAIFKAHKAGVVVFADEGDNRFHDIADAVIHLPQAPQPLPVILNTVAGHLWGYFAALSIDKEASFFRAFRNSLTETMLEQSGKNYTIYEKIADRRLRRLVNEVYPDFQRLRQQGAFSLSHVRTITDLALLLKYAAGKLPLEDYWHEYPDGEGFISPVELLDITLGQVIDELSRPIDAIRHQAKTVTVGTSRKEPQIRGIIFELLKELGFSSKVLTAKNILALTALQPAVREFKGYILYDVDKLDGEGRPTDLSTISIRKRSGIALDMKSRVETSPALMGTKRTIVSTGHAYVGYGKTDGASLLIIPLLGEQTVNSLLLIHLGINEGLSLREKKNVLGYRYNDIRNIINEYNLSWDDLYLDKLPLMLLLGDPVELIAERIRQETQKADGREQL